MEKLVPKLIFPEFEEEWNRYSLKQLVTAYRLGGNYENSEAMTSVPLIKMGNVGRGKIDISKTYYIVNSETYNKEDILKEGDILFNTRNTLDLVGKVSIWRGELPFALYNSNLMKISFSRQVEETNRFMNYYFNLPHVIEQLRSIATGTTSVAAIYNKDLNSLKINLPSLPEQTKIAEFLTAIDKRIELLTAKKEKLTLYKKGVMQKIFNQELRFKQDDGGEFPEWEETTLGKIGSVVKLKNKENQITQVFTNSAKYGVVQQGDFFEREITTEVNLKNYYVIDSGQFVYNPRISNLAPVGPIGMNKMGKGLLSPLYTVFSISNGHLAFFEQYFKSTLWHQYMRDNGNSGARSDRMSVTVGVLMNLPLYIPTLMEQTKIAMFLTSLDTEIQKVEQQITLNHTYKKGLLQQMFV